MTPDPVLLPIFASEQAEHLQVMRPLVEAIARGARSGAGGVQDSAEVRTQRFEQLHRSLHTLKGAARAVGIEAVEMLSHALEGAVAQAQTGQRLFDEAFAGLLGRSFDAFEDILSRVISGQPSPSIANLLREASGAPATAAAVSETPSSQAPQTEAAAAQEATPADSFIRVHTAALDELMQHTAEVVATVSAEGFASSPETAGEAEWGGHALRAWMHLRRGAAAYLRTHRDDPDFAPVAECIDAAETQLRHLASHARLSAIERRQRDWNLYQIAERLDDSAARVRMSTAAAVFSGFGAMVRSLAAERGIAVSYQAEGLDLPADRAVLQALRDPLMHVLRNALSHGLEPETERAAMGKPVIGSITLRVHTSGDRLLVSVSDDGRGLDYGALAAEAVRQRILSPAEVDTAPRERLADLIFRSGFSTSASLTTLSGRGVGLAVVRHAVGRLQGAVRMESVTGRGATVTISAPITLSGQQILFASASGFLFGIPASYVERMLKLRAEDIHTVEGQPVYVLDGVPMPVYRLATALGLESVAASRRGASHLAVLVSVGSQRALLVVDDLADVREAVVKPLQLPQEMSGYGAGAVAMSDGTVAVVLNLADVLDNAGGFGGAAAAQRLELEEPSSCSGAAPAARILVVDDSITTRSLEKNLFQANGYRVEVAVDGVEALEKLRESAFDLVVTDIQMPRMDGFQLLEQIKADPTLAQIPVIVVSSVEDRNSQERGLRMGAEAFIVKRKFDQREVLETVQQIL